MVASLRRQWAASPWLWLVAAAWIVGSAGAALGEDADGERVSFRREVAPILLQHCVACHGPQAAEGGYRLDSYERAMAEGNSFTPGFWPEELELSEAFRRIASADPFERMPPETEPLPDEQIERLRQWIEQGAKFDGPDPAAPLAAIVPPPSYPEPPSSYAHRLPITGLALAPGGEQLVAGGYHELTLWDVATGQLDDRIANVPQRVYAVDVSSDGRWIAAAGGTPGMLGEVRLIDRQRGEVQRVVASTGDVVLDAVFDPAGERLAVGGADSVLRVIDVRSGSELLAIASHSDWIRAVAWSQDGARIASASRDRTSKVFDAGSGELLVTYAKHEASVGGVAFHPDGDEVYSAGADNRLHRWKIGDGERTADVGLSGEPFRMRVGGSWLFVATAEPSVRQLTADDHQQVRSLGDLPDAALAVAYDAASKRVAAGCFSGHVRVWDAQEGELVGEFLALPEPAQSSSP